MKITGRSTGGVGSLGTQGSGKAAKGARSESRGDVGQVNISAEARALQDVGVGPENGIRDDMVAEARAMINAGQLDTDENIDQALDRLLAHLV